MDITADLIQRALASALPEIAYSVREDSLEALKKAHARAQTQSRGYAVLDLLLQNDLQAQKEKRPLCQDTGSVWIALELSYKDRLLEDPFFGANDLVARLYKEGKLRKSIVRDALLDRTNTQTNTPVFTELKFCDAEVSTLHVLLKGGGSDNASVLKMLNPGDGLLGLKNFVLDTVIEKASKACPPLLLAIGVGGTFDTVVSLAKHQLLREIGSKNPNPKLQEIEEDFMRSINALGLGPGGLGGEDTALAVHIGTAPCHIAAFPVAINMGCSALRSKSINLKELV